MIWSVLLQAYSFTMDAENKASKSINTNTWFLSVKFSSKVFSVLLSAWWQLFGWMPSSQLSSSCYWKQVKSPCTENYNFQGQLTNYDNAHDMTKSSKCEHERIKRHISCHFCRASSQKSGLTFLHFCILHLIICWFFVCLFVLIGAII